MIRPALVEDHHTLVCSRFFFDYCLPTDTFDPFKGIMDFLPYLYLNSGENSSLQAAVAATSHLNFHRRSETLVRTDKTIAFNYYTESLKRVQNELQCETTASSDQLLMAVYLLGIYEVSQAQPIRKRSICTAHILSNSKWPQVTAVNS